MTVSLQGCGKVESTSIKVRGQTESAADIERDCRDPLLQRALTEAQNEFPDTLPFSERTKSRAEYIGRNHWQFFHQNGNSVMGVDDYVTSEWATYLAYAPTGSCVLHRQEFLLMLLGDPNDPRSGWNLKSSVTGAHQYYAGMDSGGKGYVTKSDIRPRAIASYEFAYRHHGDTVFAPTE